jgi:hypothetical protein
MENIFHRASEYLSNTESALNLSGLNHGPVAGSAEHYDKQVELYDWNQRFGSYDGIAEDVREIRVTITGKICRNKKNGE